MKPMSPPDKPLLDALFEAQKIAFAPFVFQAARVALRLGVLDAIGQSPAGLSLEAIAQQTGVSLYGVQVLVELALTAEIVRSRSAPDGTTVYCLTKTGHCLAYDEMTRTNLEFTHEVCYRGLAHLEEAVLTGRPAGLKEFGPWPTIYPALSSLPPAAQQSWFKFDHFHSDQAFDAALRAVVGLAPRRLYDIGGNTGRWAKACLTALPDLRVAIVDLPEQLALAQTNPALDEVRGRLETIPINWLDEQAELPRERQPDTIWMSQFLDCFSPAQVRSILTRARSALAEDGRLLILEPLWDLQRHPAASFSLACTSLYFTAMANGNSRMFGADELREHLAAAGLQIDEERHGLGISHSLFVCSRARS